MVFVTNNKRKPNELFLTFSCFTISVNVMFRGVYLGQRQKGLQVANTANGTLVGLPRGIMGTRQ